MLRRRAAGFTFRRGVKRGATLVESVARRGGIRARSRFRVRAGPGVRVGQLIGHRRGTLVPVGGLLGQRPRHDPLERPRRPRGKRRQRLLDVAEGDLDGGIAVERRMAGQHLVQHDAGAVQVGGGGDRQPAGLLGRHVSRGAHDRGRPSLGGALGQARDPQVAHLDLAARRDQHVGRLDVAVHDLLGVRMRERAAELLGDFAGGPRREPAAAPEPRGQALALDQLGHVVEPLLGLPDVVDLDDAGVADAGQQLCLAFEALGPVGVLGPPRLDHLDGHAAGEPTVVAPIHPAEGPLADQLAQFVPAVERAAHQVGRVRHRSRLPWPRSARG